MHTADKTLFEALPRQPDLSGRVSGHLVAVRRLDEAVSRLFGRIDMRESVAGRSEHFLYQVAELS